MVVARCKAILDAEAKCRAEAEVWVEETEAEQGSRLPSKQKGQAEGE